MAVDAAQHPVAHSVANNSPWLQALRIAFIAFYACTVFAAARWLTTNVIEVGPGHRAVVLHFGVIAREQSSGLLWAWPQPVDEVVLVPSAETVMERQIATLTRSQAARDADDMAYDDDEGGPVSDALAGSGYLLTGDGAIVQLDVRVFYKVTEPRAFVLQNGHLPQNDHVLPALERLATRSALAICAGRDLDRILVARPELLAAGNGDAEQRERLRKDLLARINFALGDLQRQGLGLGIEAIRVDVQSSLPRDTLNAFNAVLTASQLAEQGLADARSDAARVLQQATQAADRSLQVAGANASERTSKAQADTATITQLADSLRKGTEPGLLLRVYRERLPNLLKQAGDITAVDPRSDARLVISGADK